MKVKCMVNCNGIGYENFKEGEFRDVSKETAEKLVGFGYAEQVSTENEQVFMESKKVSNKKASIKKASIKKASDKKEENEMWGDDAGEDKNVDGGEVSGADDDGEGENADGGESCGADDADQDNDAKATTE